MSFEENHLEDFDNLKRKKIQLDLAERMAKSIGHEFNDEFVLDWIKLHSEKFSDLVQEKPEIISEYEANPSKVLEYIENELYDHELLQEAA